MNVAGLPPAIRASARCVLWRYELRDGRLTKVPYVATAPARRAAVDDPATWCPFHIAEAAFRTGYGDGVGLVLGAGLCGVDLDHGRDPRTGAVSDEVMAVIRLLDSYTEVSPSRTGLHVLARGVLPPGRRRRGLIEVYGGGRFFTLTGWHVVGTPVTLEERTAALAALHRQVFGVCTVSGVSALEMSAGAPFGASACGTSTISGTSASYMPYISPSYSTDAMLIAHAHAARNGQKFARLWAGDASGYASRSEADLALCSLLAFWTGNDPERIDRLFRASGLMRPKWNSRRGEETYGARTIARALSGMRQLTGHPAGATKRED
jgi:primase-polymerase (primpol)-like protein